MILSAWLHLQQSASPCIYQHHALARINARPPCIFVLVRQHWTHMYFGHVIFWPLGDVVLDCQPHLWEIVISSFLSLVVPVWEVSYTYAIDYKSNSKSSFICSVCYFSFFPTSAPHDVRLHSYYAATGSCITSSHFVALLSTKYLVKSSSLLRNQCR